MRAPCKALCFVVAALVALMAILHLHGHEQPHQGTDLTVAADATVVPSDVDAGLAPAWGGCCVVCQGLPCVLELGNRPVALSWPSPVIQAGIMIFLPRSADPPTRHPRSA